MIITILKWIKYTRSAGSIAFKALSGLNPYGNRYIWRGGRPKYVVLVLVAMLVVVSVSCQGPFKQRPLAQSLTASPTAELRGVWLTNIDSEVLFSRDRISTALPELADLNFNTVYPTVWNWGYTLYPSAVAEPVTGAKQGLYPDLDDAGGRDQKLEATQAGRDMLQEVVDVAQPLGLQVLPWFEFGFMAPANSELARRHPEWITQDRNGKQTVGEGRHPRVWLNPFHPEVQALLVNLVEEVVSNYAVAGIQFDDHLGLPVALGYDDYTVALYQKEHQGQSPPVDARDPDWMRWRADRISAVMRQVYNRVKAEQPDAIVSLSPNPREFAYDEFLQDWATWVDQGYVDQLVVQLYRDNRERFVAELDQPALKAVAQQVPVAIGILSGLKQRPVPFAWLQEQVKLVRDRTFSGVSFFFYETLWNGDNETRSDRHDGLASLFSQPAPAPSLNNRLGG